MDLTNESSKTQLVLRYVFVVLIVWTVGFGFDRLLARDGVTRTEILVLSNFLTGLVTAYLFYTLARTERIRREVVRERLRTIAEMNHHIRNALQVITYATAVGKDDESVELIRSSVERIEWALREVLPGQVAAPEQTKQEERQPSLQV
jgi:uncharacterized membrane protein (DUF485 family)